jgi:hypothetical protein
VPKLSRNRATLSVLQSAKAFLKSLGSNTLMQTANIRLADGSGHVIPNVPWTALKVLDKKSKSAP